MAEGKVVISAQNRIKEGLDAAQRDLSGFEGAAKKVGETLKNAFAVTAIIASVEKLGRAMFDAYKEFGEGERRANALSIALDNNAVSIQKATSLIDTMARRTLASKDDVEALVAELAALGKSDADIEAITTASVNLANVTGKDLNSAFTLVNATYSGTTGKLAQLLPEIGNLSEKQLAAGAATKLINDKFSELSRNLAENDIPQKLKNIEDGFGDMKENIGRDLAPIFNPFLEGINSIITAWNQASEAARIHKNLLLATSPEQKLALNQQIIANNRPRLDVVNAKLDEYYTAYKKYADGESRLKQNPGYMALVSERNDLVDANVAAQKMVDYYTAEIKKIGADKPRPVSLVPLMGPGKKGDKTEYGSLPKGSVYYGNGSAIAPDESAPFDSRGEAYRLALSDTSLQNVFKMMGSIGLQSRDDLESYGWSADMLAKPVIEFRDDLESYGWTGLGESSFDQFFKGWAKAQAALRPDEGGDITGMLYGNSAVDPARAQFTEWAATVGAEMRDDLESYNWEGLGDPAIRKIFDGWAKAQAKIAPEEGGDLSEMLFKNALADPIQREVSAWADRMATETRDDLENYGWDGLGKWAAQEFFEGWADRQSSYNPDDPQASPNVLGTAPKLGGLELFMQNIGELFKGNTAIFGESLRPMMEAIAPIIESFGIFSEALTTAAGWLILLIPIIEGFAAVIAPATSAVIKPLLDFLVGLGQTIGSLLLPLFDALAPSIAIIAQILTTVFTPILQILQPIFQAIALVLQTLAPLFGFLAKALIILMAPVQWLADLFTWVGEVIKTFAWNITHLANQKAGPGEFYSDAFTSIPDKLRKVDEMMANSQSLQDGYNTGATDATKSAEYRTQKITINIYQNAPVVGSGGMDEFVQMIRTRFNELAYFGATA